MPRICKPSMCARAQTQWLHFVELGKIEFGKVCKIRRSLQTVERTKGGHRDQTFRSNIHLNSFPYEFRGCCRAPRQRSNAIRRPVAVGGYADNRGLHQHHSSRGADPQRYDVWRRPWFECCVRAGRTKRHRNTNSLYRSVPWQCIRPTIRKFRKGNMAHSGPDRELLRDMDSAADVKMRRPSTSRSALISSLRTNMTYRLKSVLGGAAPQLRSRHTSCWFLLW